MWKKQLNTENGGLPEEAIGSSSWSPIVNKHNEAEHEHTQSSNGTKEPKITCIHYITFTHIYLRMRTYTNAVAVIKIWSIYYITG